MKVFHGTTEEKARKILRYGLQPRSISGEKGNWDHSEPSIPTNVYLTSVYGVYFATCASHDEDERGAIIEIDMDKIDQTLLRPDEDFVTEALSRDEQALKKLRLHKVSKEKRHDFVRRNIDRYRDWWEQSIKFLGNVAYRGTIQPFAITRIAAVDFTDKLIAANALAPTISLMNFKFCESRYRALAAYAMGDPVTAAEIVNSPEIPESEVSGFAKMQREQLAAIEECIAARNTRLIFETQEDLVLQSPNHSG